MKRKLLISLAIVLQIVLLTVVLAGPSLAYQGRQFLEWAVIRKLTVQQGGSTFNSDVTLTGDLTQTGNQAVTGNIVLTGDLTHSGNVANRSLFLRYQDVAAAPAIRAEAGVVSATTTLTASILGIETPRNVVLTYVTVTTATAGNVTVTGVDARGSSTTENIAVGAISGTQTLTGATPWVSISQFTLPTRSEAVTFTVAGGQLFGLPIVPQAAGDVYHVTVNETPQANPTVDTTNGTFNPVSTPAADVDYNVWMKQ